MSVQIWAATYVLVSGVHMKVQQKNYLLESFQKKLDSEDTMFVLV